MSMTCHASGALLATAGADRKVLVWDVDGGFCTHFFKGHKGMVTSIIFHPDSDKYLVCSLLYHYNAVGASFNLCCLIICLLSVAVLWK